MTQEQGEASGESGHQTGRGGGGQAPSAPAAPWQRWAVRAAVVAAFVVVGLLALRGLREHRLKMMADNLLSMGDFPELERASPLLKAAEPETDGVIAAYVKAGQTRAWDPDRRMLFVARRQVAERLPDGTEVLRWPVAKREVGVPCLMVMRPSGPESFSHEYSVFEDSLDFKRLSCRQGMLSIEFTVERKTSEALGIPPEKVWTATLSVDEAVALISPDERAVQAGLTAAEIERQRLVALLKKAGANL